MEEEYEQEFEFVNQFDVPVPYNYEPLRQSQTVPGRINGHRREMELWSIENQWRVEQVSWCLCAQCEPMPSAIERVCCREIDQYRALLEKLDLPEDITCLTRHHGFSSVCLDRQYRYTGYRQVVRWAFGTLGRQIRKPIPACVVAAIRKQYPEEGGTYKGFEWPDLGEASFL
ncbi:hypothetical protein ACEWY4_007603 [Coilia grayii]|uniref:P2X purinoreceptor 7 intracellular domain-containing protein n=1 Tax=Coilia grayii TaxID=363190 RepID=A0ABD1KGQ3_9TELE